MRLLAFFLLGLAAIFASFPALAGTRECAGYPEMVARLKDQYGERPAARGLVRGDAVAQIFISPETGRWTVIETGSDERSCIVIRGRHFQLSVTAAPVDEGPA